MRGQFLTFTQAFAVGGGAVFSKTVEIKTSLPGGGVKDSIIVCRNNQGLELRATPLRMTRYVVVFEVYNPYSLLQLSEVLSDFRIIISERVVYSGRAVVSNMVNTGILVVCEVTLDESWLDVDVFSSPLASPERLGLEFADFLREWAKVYKILPEFKIAVADMQSLLIDLRRWLEQVEFGVRSEPTRDRVSMEREVIGKLEGAMVPLVLDWFELFDGVADKIEEAQLPAHRSYARRLLHPLVLCSPFVYRTYHKPLGYAGDYEMVNMILREPYEGASLFAKVVNVCFLKNPPAEAHRNRILYLRQMLVAETARVKAAGRPARVLNLGCGPAKEIQDFIEFEEVSNDAELSLLDFNDETLEHTGALLNQFCQRFQRRTELRMLKRSVHQILKEAGRPKADMPHGSFDLVYCAGLFDYMSDRICKRLMNIFYDLLAPGGLLIATNVDAARPFRHSMDFLLEWHLIFRNQRQFEALAPDQAPAGSGVVRADPTGVNVFIEVRKPSHGQSS